LISHGLSYAEDGIDDAVTLLKRADELRYSAKRYKRKKVFLSIASSTLASGKPVSREIFAHLQITMYGKLPEQEEFPF